MSVNVKSRTWVQHTFEHNPGSDIGETSQRLCQEEDVYRGGGGAAVKVVK